jgi:hypothetical protein
MPESAASSPTTSTATGGALIRACDVVLSVVGLLLYPASALVVFARTRDFPRRAPNLGFLVRGARFRSKRCLAAGWMSQHFRLVEENAPWLSLSFELTSDFCVTSLQSRQFPILDPPAIACHRIVTRSYIVEGSARGRLGGLRSALLAVGWGRPDLDPFGHAERESHQRECVRTISWQPAPGFDTPGGLESTSPFGASPISRHMHMQVDWSELGPLGDIAFPFHSIGTEKSGRPSALYRPLEMSQSRVADSRPHRSSPAQADSAPTSEIAVTIDVEYYQNPNVNHRPGWIPKRVIPVMRSRAI